MASNGNDSITPQPPGAPQKKSHKVRNWILGISGVIAVFIILGAIFGKPANSGQPTIADTTPANTNTQPVNNPSPAPPLPNPEGTYQGSCDYTLGSGINSDYHVVGEIDLTNTGNVGVIVHTRITWPQEGSPPITARKTVHLPVGATNKPVRFRISVSSDQIDLLQSWQDGHDLKDGCTYHASFNENDTYGPVNG